MKKEKKVWAITLIAFWWLAPNLIQAQQDSIKTSKLDEVVITATKFPKNVNETAKVLTIIDEEQIARSAGKDVSQILNEQVGMVISGSNSNPGKDKAVYLRGAGNAYTIILIDGIPVSDPSGFGGAYDLRLLSVDQIERIEILKGSQSTLYGTDAIAGVINIITKKKGDRPITVNGTGSYGSYGTYKGNLGVSGSTKVFDYSVGFTRFGSDGISEAKDPTGNGNFERDGFEQDAFQTNLAFKLSSSLLIKPFFRYSTFNGKFDSGSFTDATDYTYNSNLLNTGANLTYSFPKGSLNVLYGYSKTDRNYDFGSSPSQYRGRFYHAEPFVDFKMNNHFQFITGVGYQEFQTQDDVNGHTFSIASPYLSLFFKELGSFSFELGGRLNHHSKYGDNFTYSFNPAYWLNRQFKIFANVSTGFKSPTIDQLFGTPPYTVPNLDLKPEKSQSLEGGVQFFNAERDFDVRLTAFQRDITDVITYFTLPTFEGKYLNLNKQSDHGVEIELGKKIGSRMAVQVFYAYVDGKITDKSGTSDTTYNNLLRRPKHTFGLKTGYQVTPRLFVQLNLKTFGQRNDIYFDMINFAATNVTMDAYTLVDLYAEYKLFKDKVKVFIDMKNLLNQDYMEVYGYNTLKFNVMSGLNFKF